MGGRHAITAAATFPEAVRAAASVHGGRLVSDAPDSAHRRLPEVTGLSFSDETPFVGDQAKLWLDAEVLSAAGGGEASGDGAGAGEAWQQALAEAKQTAAGGDSEAIVPGFGTDDEMCLLGLLAAPR